MQEDCGKTVKYLRLSFSICIEAVSISLVLRRRRRGSVMMIHHYHCLCRCGERSGVTRATIFTILLVGDGQLFTLIASQADCLAKLCTNVPFVASLAQE